MHGKIFRCMFVLGYSRLQAIVAYTAQSSGIRASVCCRYLNAKNAEITKPYGSIRRFNPNA